MNPFRLMQTYLINRPRFSVLVNRAAGLVIFAAAIVILAELMTPSTSQATLPVIDVAAVGQLVAQTEQYAQNLERMTEQILLLKQQVQSLTGHYGMGNVTGPVNTWGTTSWNDIVNMVNTGVNPGDAAQVLAFKAAQAQNISQFPALAVGLQTANPRMNAVYSSSFHAGLTGMSAGQGTYTSLQSHLTDLQLLKDKIEQTSTVKAAIDLNTAVVVKNAQISAELLRTQAMGLYLQGNTQNGYSNGQAAEAEFFSN